MIPATPDMRLKLLEIATELVELVGYNAFSFRDLADRVGITTASVHYHFPTKGDLGVALVARQRELEESFRQRLERESPDAWKRLRAFATGFRSNLENGRRMCLCGMLAAEHSTIPGPVLELVRAFFRDNEVWIARNLLDGRKSGRITFTGPAAPVARALMSAIEGAMLAAKAFGDLDRFDSVAEWHLAQIKARA
jgi:TetR/AcrR family transcriptional regulator, transcriptional repressor for nem operon